MARDAASHSVPLPTSDQGTSRTPSGVACGSAGAPASIAATSIDNAPTAAGRP
jgi:hypothetical protein